MPTRWRLTLWFALVLGVILALSGLVANVLLERNLVRHIDDELRAFSARIHGTVATDGTFAPVDYGVIHDRMPAVNEFASPGTYFQLIDDRGRVVLKSDSLADLELPVVLPLIGRAFEGREEIRTVSAGAGADLRVMVSAVRIGDDILVLEVAQSSTFVRTSMGLLRWSILISVALALTAATVSGGVIVRNALWPVARITQIASGIGGGRDLSRRIDYTGPDDEIGRLAAAFNRMLGDLDKAFQSQRHFVADASHELRGPLTVIRGNLDLLKRSLGAEDRAASLQAIGSETDRMSKIVNDLLALAELDAGRPLQMEDVSLSEIIHEESHRARSTAAKHRVVLGNVDDAVARADRGRVRQVLSSFMDNAIRYTPEGGTVTLSSSRDGEWARMEVSDTGIGISQDDLPHIFDRFYRVDKARSRGSGGTGLGLAIAKAIVEQHGGKITVASEPGKGSTFTAWLKISPSSKPGLIHP